MNKKYKQTDIANTCLICPHGQISENIIPLKKPDGYNATNLIVLIL